jgi:pimeloyl-ACP methyl ester carboxylesterase
MTWVAGMDSPTLKPGNQARVRWFSDDKSSTDTVLMYLHGFTASPGEAGKLPERMADALGANLYVHRWPGHGSEAPDAMRGLTLDVLLDSATEALANARTLGRSTIIVGTSLGASLALWLAATHSSHVAAVAAWSPGVHPAHPKMLEQLCVLQNPVVDPRPRSSEVQAYWSDTVHPDGYRALRDLFTILADDPPWHRVVCPVFLGYFRSPSGEEDQTASVPAMLDMFDALGTPAQFKAAMPFATGAHGIGSPAKSPLADLVASTTLDFLRRAIPAPGLSKSSITE